VAVTLSLTGGDDANDGSAKGSSTSPAAKSAPGSNDSSGDSGPVTCWDGSAAPDAAHCPVPTGLAGMATVFPGLTADCTVVDSPIEGKAEVYECEHDGFLVRYTRWDEGFDKESYYSLDNQVASQEWEVGGEPAGLQWFSIDNDPEETQPYQWSAAYDGQPFSLSIEGDTSADRSAGVSGLQLVPLSQIGLE
jgi:hypothetical protein